LAVNVIAAADAAAEQQPAPPIQGVTGTIATDTSRQEVEAGARALLVKAKRLFRWNRRSTVPGGEEAGEESLAGLKRGAAVIVHNTKPGENLTPEAIDRLADDGLTRMEGVVLSVDRTDRTIAIRLADGTRQTFRLSDQTAGGVDKDLNRTDNGTTVVIFVKDEAGARVVHYFKRVP
jgi:hypothetical protein